MSSRQFKCNLKMSSQILETCASTVSNGACKMQRAPLENRAPQAGDTAKRTGREKLMKKLMKIKFRRAEARRHPRQLFVMLSQFNATTFSVPVRRFQVAKSKARQFAS
jgi:hypothetical protein